MTLEPFRSAARTVWMRRLLIPLPMLTLGCGFLIAVLSLSYRGSGLFGLDPSWKVHGGRHRRRCWSLRAAIASSWSTGDTIMTFHLRWPHWSVTVRAESLYRLIPAHARGPLLMSVPESIGYTAPYELPEAARALSFAKVDDLRSRRPT
jgi:hypothetical protein